MAVEAATLGGLVRIALALWIGSTMIVETVVVPYLRKRLRPPERLDVIGELRNRGRLIRLVLATVVAAIPAVDRDGRVILPAATLVVLAALLGRLSVARPGRPLANGAVVADLLAAGSACWLLFAI